MPVCVTALGLVVLAGVVHFSIEKNHKQVRTVTELNAMNYAERMASQNPYRRLLSVTMDGLTTLMRSLQT